MTAVDPLLLEARVETIRVRTLAGESAASIAIGLGVSSRTVTRWRARLGIAKAAAPRLTGEQEARIQSLADDGCSVQEIARTVGCSYTAVRRRRPDAVWSREQCAEWMVLMRAKAATP